MSRGYKLRSKISIESWLISVLFIMGLLIRLYRLGDSSFVDDEIFTAIRINHSLLDTIGLLRHGAFPPLHYIILNLWARAFGNGEWALRFPSAIFSGLTIIVIYKLGAELFSKGVGLISAALLVFSPFALEYAQDAKMYALFWFITAVSFLFFFRFVRDQRGSPYRFYIIASILCCYTMYIGFLLLLTQSIIFLFIGGKTRWKKWFTGQLIIVSFCIPWLIYFLCAKHEFPGLGLPGDAFDYFMFFENAFLLIIGSCRDSLIGTSGVDLLGRVNCFLYVFLMTFFLIDSATISYKNKKKGLPLATNCHGLFIWITIPTFFYFMLNYFFIHADLCPRYIGFLQVPIILLVSSQMDAFPGVIKKILVGVLVVIAMSNIYLYFRDYVKYPPRVAGDVFVLPLAARGEGGLCAIC